MTDYTELKRLLSAQISLHQIAIKTETVEDENTYLDADGALNDYLTEQDLFIEEIALSALTENTRLESEAVYAAAGFAAARDEIERLKAEIKMIGLSRAKLAGELSRLRAKHNDYSTIPTAEQGEQP